MEGGYLFYKDSSNTRGLVASLNPANQGGNLYAGSYLFHWGCFGSNVDGADGIIVGSGYQNTIDIINEGCISSDDGHITAADAANSYQAEGYNDWFLPSKDELMLMIPILNDYFYSPHAFWSSSEGSATNAWYAHVDANFYNYGKTNPNIVLPIRAFGNWSMVVWMKQL